MIQIEKPVEADKWALGMLQIKSLHKSEGTIFITNLLRLFSNIEAA